MWREDVEIADLKLPAKGRRGHPEVQNHKPSLQQDAGATGGSGLYLLLKRRGSRSKGEIMQNGCREEMDCLHGIRGAEKVAIVRRSLGCQSPPLPKPWVMSAFQPHWDMALAPSQHVPANSWSKKNSSLSVIRNQKARIHINMDSREKEEETGKQTKNAHEKNLALE